MSFLQELLNKMMGRKDCEGSRLTELPLILGSTHKKSNRPLPFLESLVHQAKSTISFLSPLRKVAFCTLTMTPKFIERQARDQQVELSRTELDAISNALKEFVDPIGPRIKKEIKIVVEWWYPTPTVVRIGTLSTMLTDERTFADESKVCRSYEYSPYPFRYQSLWQVLLPLTGNDEMDYGRFCGGLLRETGRLRLIFNHSELLLQLYGGRFSEGDGDGVTIYTIPLEAESLVQHLTGTSSAAPQRQEFAGGSGSFSGNDFIGWKLALVEYWLFSVRILEIDEQNLHKGVCVEMLDGPLKNQECLFIPRFNITAPPKEGQEGHLRVTSGGEIIWHALSE